MPQSKIIIPIIVIAQFCCTSLWFAGNAVMGDLIVDFHLGATDLASLTTAVQVGFICGTLVFALLMIPDRFPPARVFFLSAVFGAAFNLCTIIGWNNLISLLSFRFCTGFFLAGIYPVGMKIAADYREKGLGVALGFLVGALVLGTAFPHLLKGMTSTLPWRTVLFITSGLALFGGVLMLLFVPDGPYRKQSQSLQFSGFFSIFKSSNFRAAAFGYFGHMWELYSFWALVPVMLVTYSSIHVETNLNVAILSFVIIGVGSIACVLSGYLSQRYDTKGVATWALSLSGICCLLSPLFFYVNYPAVFICFLCSWSVFVIADSPLFSTLVAQNVDVKLKGTALTIVNSLGFLITILSIQFIQYLKNYSDSPMIYMSLAIGPILGLWALLKKEKQEVSI